MRFDSLFAKEFDLSQITSLVHIMYQIVDSIVWLDLAHLNEPLSESGHYMLHQIVTQWGGLCL